MENFYKCDMLSLLRERKKEHNFRLLSEKIGVLLIFDDNFELKFILVESWVDSINSELSSEEQSAIRFSEHISCLLGKSFYFFRYEDNEIRDISTVQYRTSKSGNDLKKCNVMTFFNEHVEECTLKEKNVKKQINKSLSTPFHQWQRKYLDYKGFSIDIDMLFASEGKVKFIVEIKRSKISNWKPYKEDANNYLAMSKLCEKIGVPFLLFFVPKIEKNNIIIDCINNLKIYDIYHRVGAKYLEPNSIFFNVRCENISLEELIKKDYSFFTENIDLKTWRN